MARSAPLDEATNAKIRKQVPVHKPTPLFTVELLGGHEQVEQYQDWLSRSHSASLDGLCIRLCSWSIESGTVLVNCSAHGGNLVFPQISCHIKKAKALFAVHTVETWSFHRAAVISRQLKPSLQISEPQPLIYVAIAG